MADPAWINASAGAPSYTAAELRRLDSVLEQPQSSNRFGAVQGVRPGGGVITSLAGSTITVQAHAGIVSPDLTTTQGAYRYQLPTNETHALTAAHLTLARTDLVTIRVDDHDEDASGARTVTSAYVVGTAGAGVPALPARSFEIARIAVPASGGGSPSLTERARYTVASGGILPVRDTSDLPSHYESRVAAQLDTDRLMISDGSAWQRGPHWSVAGRTGCRLYQNAQTILATLVTAISWDTEDQDSDGFISVPGTTVTIPAGAGGLYALTFHVGGPFTGTGRHFVEILPTSTLTNLPAYFRMPVMAVEDAGMVTATIPLLAGDSFVCQVYHSSASSGSFESWLSCYRIAV